MAIRGYILIDTEVGSAKAVDTALRELPGEYVHLVSVDTVTGPFDAIVQFETPDLDQLGTWINEHVQTIPGVKRTTTCLAIWKGH